MQGRDYVLPDDIKVLAEPVLSHRIMMQPAARLRNLTAGQLVQEILTEQPVPGGDLQGQGRG